MSDTIDTGAAEAWMAGDMQGAQALSQPIPDEHSASSEPLQPWLENHLAAGKLQDGQRPEPAAHQAAAETAMITNAASKLSELGAEGQALVQEWGGHTSPDFKENLAYAKSAFADIAKTRPDLIAKVDASGLGNDPAVLKILSELGRQKAHTYGDNTVSSRRFNDEPSRALPAGTSAAQRELDTIYKKTPPGTEGYRTREVQTRVQQLQEMIHGTGPAVGMGGRLV
ncbi:hypothetical protein ACFQX9_23435 [Bradyrhizobium sp. GCM10028915]|uniref:hypothetical protein n=1 Tax=Bradyrhizobium sp. GCM10028915 TaxID=3273385 RepID=UPI0036188859